MLFVLPLMFNGYFKDDRRTVFRELIWIVVLFLLLTVFHAMSIIVENSVTPFRKSLFESFYINISIGIFPIMIMLFLAYIRSLEIKLKELELFSSEYLDRSHSDRLIRIPKGKGNEDFKLSLGDLIYIKSSNNYSEIFFKKEDKVKKTIVRVPISEIESKVNSEYLYRIHRGFIINFLAITKVLGNANKCSIKLKEIDEKIPVSRSKRKEMLENLHKLPIKVVV